MASNTVCALLQIEPNIIVIAPSSKVSKLNYTDPSLMKTFMKTLMNIVFEVLA